MPKPPATTEATTAAPRAKRVRRAATSARRSRRRAAVSHELIAVRAYEIHLSQDGGDPVEHWLRAERELVGA